MEPTQTESSPPGGAGEAEELRMPCGRRKWIVAGTVVFLALILFALTRGEPQEGHASLTFVGFSNYFPRPWLMETQFHAYCWFTNGPNQLSGLRTSVSRRIGNEWVDDDAAYDFFTDAAMSPSDRLLAERNLRPGEAVLVNFLVGEPTLPLRVVMEVRYVPNTRLGVRLRLEIWFRRLLNRPSIRIHWKNSYSVTNEFWPRP